VVTTQSASSRRAGILTGATLVVALLVHLRSAMHYPMPFSDEPMFLLPARAFASDHSLAVPMLNAPHGLFWTPHGYQITLGLVFSVLPNTLAVARWTSFAAMALALCLFSSATRAVSARYRTPLLLVCCAAFLSAGSIQAANLARMEPLVVLDVALVVWLVSRRRYLAAYGALLIGCTVHAVLWPAAVTFLIGLVIVRRHFHTRRWEYAVLAAGGAAVAAEAVYYARHLHLAITQMQYQASRKGASSAHNSTWALGCIELAIAVAILVYCRRQRSDVGRYPRLAAASLIASLACGIGLYLAYSYEFEYAVYVTGILPLLMVFAGFLIVSDARPARSASEPELAVPTALTPEVAPALV
jgi:hypothetical protein